MIRCLRWLPLFALLLPPLAFAAQFAKETSPTEKRVYKQTGDTSLELWIWKPADWSARDRRSAIVFYHGGGWHGGSPNSLARQSAQLAARGMVAVSVQYRLVAQPGVTVQNCVEDAKSAFRWVRAHAAELGIDPNKIAAGGGSAGGHLAAGLSTLHAINDPADDATVSTRPAALVLFNPASDLEAVRSAAIRKLGAGRSALNPAAHLERGHPPTIIFHGEDDTTVPIASVRGYAAKITDLGGECTVVGFAGQVHAFFNREPYIWDTLKQAEVFLEKHALLKPADAASAATAAAAAIPVQHGTMSSVHLLTVTRATARNPGAGKPAPDGLRFTFLIVPKAGVSGAPALKETRDMQVAGVSYQAKTRAALGQVFEPETIVDNPGKFFAANPTLAASAPDHAKGSLVLTVTLGGAPLTAGTDVEIAAHAGFNKQVETFVFRTNVPAASGRNSSGAALPAP